MLADYRALSLTTGRHPLALLRHQEPFRSACSAATLKKADMVNWFVSPA